MQDTQIIQSVVDSLTGKMIYQFTVPVRTPESPLAVKRSLWDWLRRKPVPVATVETERTFTIYPTVVANQYRIAGKALGLPTELPDDESGMLALVPEHLSTIIYIIAASIQNNHLEPDAELITFLERNLDNVDIAQILAASMQGANMQSFLISIVLMNGTATILTPKTSPQDGSE